MKVKWTIHRVWVRTYDELGCDNALAKVTLRVEEIDDTLEIGPWSADTYAEARVKAMKWVDRNMGWVEVCHQGPDVT